MSTNSQTNPDNQEIDFSNVSKKMSQSYENFLSWIFRGFLFIKRNLIILIILFSIGAGLGYYLDKKGKVYNNKIIVSPNFESGDYLYAKIDLLQSKIHERDTVFLKSIGIHNTKKLGEITIKPITDIYKFVEQNEKNFELVKLMAENIDMSKVVTDEVTSKNYRQHLITFTTSGITDRTKTIDPIMKFLNDSDHFKKLKDISVKNMKVKKVANDSMITQIDRVMNEFSNAAGNSNNDKLVYYNENTQLNDILRTKDLLLQEQGNINLEFVKLDDIIKENSSVINIRNTESLNGKLKFTLPLLLIAIFIFLGLIKSFYITQMKKNKEIIGIN